MSATTKTLAELRSALADLDGELLQLAARRQRLAREVGAVKESKETSTIGSLR